MSRAEPMTRELDDFARRLGDYIATKTAGWPDEAKMREAVSDTVHLIYGDAAYEAWPLMQAFVEQHGLGTGSGPRKVTDRPQA